MELRFNIKNRFSSVWQITFCCILLTIGVENLNGQCGAPDQLPSIDCQDAPVICLQNWCYESSAIPLKGWIGFCGPNTAVNNPQYYAFIAESTNVEIQIHVDYCDVGIALQAAILGSCPWDVEDVIDCYPAENPESTMVLNASGLNIGQKYWLLIDGSSGSICGYTVTVVSGIFMPGLSGEIAQISVSEDSLFQGQEGLMLEATPSVGGAHGYYWVLGWSGDTITSTLPNITLDIPCDVDPGIYSICVRAFSGCDTTDTEVCTTVEIFEPVDIIKPASLFCQEAFPINWFDLIISQPGLYEQEFGSPGCLYDSIWQVDAYPEIPVGIIDTAVYCYDFYYEGIQYDDPGTYELIYPGQGQNGCDSSAELHLTLNAIELFVQSLCIDSQFTLHPNIVEQSLPQESLTYSWFDCNYDSLLSTSMDFTPDTAGCYCLVADYGACQDTICSSYSSDPCLSDCSLVRDTSCAGESVFFNSNQATSPDAQFHWLIDLPGAPDTYIFGQNSLLFTYEDTGWFHVSLTIVDSSFTSTCNDSFYITGHTSEASICCTGSGCGSCTDLTINLSGTPPWTLYISNNFNSDTIYNVTSSIYVYTTCPPQDSLSVYYLTVIDSFNQCSANISGDQPVFVVMHAEADASITQVVDSLCGTFVEGATYMWFTCVEKEYLSTDLCFVPDSSGCYCLEVTNVEGCSDTTCYDFLISSVITDTKSVLHVYPNPSKGEWQVTLPDLIRLPVEWTLYDVYNRPIETGWVEDNNPTIQLTTEPAAGLYYLHFMSASKQSFISRVVLQ